MPDRQLHAYPGLPGHRWSGPLLASAGPVDADEGRRATYAGAGASVHRREGTMAARRKLVIQRLRRATVAQRLLPARPVLPAWIPSPAAGESTGNGQSFRPRIKGMGIEEGVSEDVRHRSPRRLPISLISRKSLGPGTARV